MVSARLCKGKIREDGAEAWASVIANCGPQKQEGSSRTHFVDHFDKGYRVFYRSLLQDTVAQVENMSRTPPCLIEHQLRSLSNLLGLGKQDRRIKISLDSSIMSYGAPGIVKGNSPIDANDAAAGFA